MNMTSRAVLKVWLAAMVLAALLVAPVQAQPVLEQLLPGQQQPAQEQNTDNDAQNAPAATPPSGTPTASPAVTAAALPPGFSEAVAKARRQAEQYAGQLQAIETRLNDPSLPPKQVAEIRLEAEKIREALRAVDLELDAPLAQLRAQISRLGPAPKEGESEAEAVAAQRADLNKVLNELLGARAQLALVTGTAEQLSARAAQLERSRFLNNLFGSSRSILNPALWTDGLSRTGNLWSRSVALIKNFNNTLLAEQGWWALALIYGSLLLLIAAATAICRMIARYARNGNPGEVEFQKWLRTVIVPLGYTATAALAVIIFNRLFESVTPNTPRVERITESLGSAFVLFAFGRGVARSILSPTRPGWRVAPLSSAAASQWLRLSTFAIALFALNNFRMTLADVVNMDASFDVACNAAVALVLAFIVARLILIGRQESQSQEPMEEGLKPGFDWAGYMVQPAWLLVLASMIALVLGYVTFGLYLTSNLFVIAPAVALLYCIRRLSDAFVAQSLKPKSRIAKTLKSAFSMSERGINRAGIALNASVDMALLLLGLPLILGLTSLTWVDVRSWLTTAFFGFKIGDITISLSSILLAVVVFGVGLVLTRMVTGWLDRRILTPTDMDAGVRNSVRTASGYIAVIVVLLLAFAAAGVDFSNIAIVAGALSVGIGFGLQSIVNNFVSGLILLAERPIKVGDWVQVAGGEGTVRKINVRSTEIETFDRCSIIVPNSSLISDTVSNWTHDDLMGRVRVMVGVSYDADPKQVEEILIACAKAHERCLELPAPHVVFKDFGASSLDFELRMFINDVLYVAFVGSDLRFQIHKALKDAGIEIPFPQRDVHVRGLKEAIADTVAQSVAERLPKKPPRKAAGKTAAGKTPARKPRKTSKPFTEMPDDGGDGND